MTAEISQQSSSIEEKKNSTQRGYENEYAGIGNDQYVPEKEALDNLLQSIEKDIENCLEEVKDRTTYGEDTNVDDVGEHRIPEELKQYM